MNNMVRCSACHKVFIHTLSANMCVKYRGKHVYGWIMCNHCNEIVNENESIPCLKMLPKES